MKTYYEILGVGKDASEKQIKSAFRRLARRFHPDVNAGDKSAEERFKEINEAYCVLADKKKREQYDAVGHEAWVKGYRESCAPGGGGFRWTPRGAEGFGPYDNVRFYSAGGPGGFGAEDMEGMDLGDIFSGIFGRAGARGRRRSGPVRGQDVVSKVFIGMSDAVRGTERTFTIGGESDGQHTLSVKIPPGVWEGQRIRLAGKGEPGSRGGPPGDLLLEVVYQPQTGFTRENENLVLDLKVPFSVAALGGQATVQTLEGQAELTIPAGAQSGQMLRLRGKGLPRRGGGRGDLLARVLVAVPRRLDGDGKCLVEELKKYEV